MEKKPEVLWREEYSVGVEEIDNQHKKLFDLINDMILVSRSSSREEDILPVMNGLIAYKKDHFATEEKYFHAFNYPGTKEHEEAHQKFNVDLEELEKRYENDVLGLSFALIEFLENWLIEHLMSMDQEYKACFREHGLR